MAKSNLLQILWFKYGMTEEDYRAVVAAQDGFCAICRKECTRVYRSGISRLSVDHDHITGEFRGLLCADCNNGLGYFKDNPDLLMAAATYLTQRSGLHGFR